MKVFAALLLPLLLIGAVAQPAHALTPYEDAEPEVGNALADADREQINAHLDTLLDGIFEGGTEGNELIRPILSPNAPSSLADNIFWGLPSAGVTENISFQVDHEYVMGDEARLSTFLQYESADFTNSAKVFFTFRKEEGKWMLYDTDFYTQLGSPHVSQLSEEPQGAQEFELPAGELATGLGVLGFLAGFGILFILIPVAIFLAIFAFWLWMLIEACTRKEYENKALWIVLIIIFGAIAAAFYYFMQHRSYKKAMKEAVPVAPVAPAPVEPPPAT